MLLCLVGLLPLPGTPRQPWYPAAGGSNAWHLLAVKGGKMLSPPLETEENRLPGGYFLSSLSPVLGELLPGLGQAWFGDSWGWEEGGGLGGRWGARRKRGG